MHEWDVVSRSVAVDYLPVTCNKREISKTNNDTREPRPALEPRFAEKSGKL